MDLELKQSRFRVKINKTSRGYTWNATVNADNLNQLEQDIEELKVRIEKRILLWQK